MKSSRSNVVYYALLCATVTALFLVLCGIAHLNGHVLLWKADAFPQDLNFLIYEGELIRQAFSGLLSGKGLVFPSFTYGIGYGVDTAVTMSGFLCDPLNLLSAFCPPRYAHYLFLLLLLARLCLAACAFSAFCFSRGNGAQGAFVGSVSYVTCGYVVQYCILHHPEFLTIAIALPLAFIGADRIFEGKRPVVYVITLAVMFFYSLYHAFIAVVILVAYCAVRYFFVPRERGPLDFLLVVLRFVGYSLLAGALSAVSWVPVLMTLASLGRIGVSHNVSLLHSIGDYSRQALSMTGSKPSPMCAQLNPIAAFATSLFVMSGRRLLPEKGKPLYVVLVLCVIGLVTPVVGSLANGLGYSTDRWMVGVGLATSYAMCLMLPRLRSVSTSEWVRAVAAFVLLMALGLPAALYSNAAWVYLVLDLAVLAVAGFAIVGVFAGLRGEGDQDDAYQDETEASGDGAGVRHVQPLGLAGVLATAVVCLLMLSFTVASTTLMSAEDIGGAFYRELAQTEGDVWMRMYRANISRYASEIPGASVAGAHVDWDGNCQRLDASAAGQYAQGPYRFSTARLYDIRNTSDLYGVLLTCHFSSFYNQYVDEFRKGLGISEGNNSSNYIYSGQDGRLALEALLGVRYYVARDAEAWSVPETYEEDPLVQPYDAVVGTMRFYSSDAALPLVFVYGSTISPAEYAGLSAVQRQEALLQGCVLSDVDTSATDVAPVISSIAIDPRLSAGDGAVLEDGKIEAAYEGASVSLSFEGVEDCETYVLLRGVSFEARESSVKPDLLSRLMYKPATTATIRVSGGGVSRDTIITSRLDNGFGGMTDFVITVGHHDEALSQATLTFLTAGTFEFDSIEVVCQPVGTIVNDLQRLRSRGANDIELHDDRVTASVDTEHDVEYAFFSLAYSSGWTATVDGEPAEVLRADTAFMAVEVRGAGHHEIELKYVTPGARAGAVASVAGIVVCCVWGIASRVRRGRNRGDSSQC